MNWLGPVIRRWAGAQKDLGLIPFWLSLFFNNYGLWTVKLWPERSFRLSLKSHFFKLCCWLCVCVCVHVQIIVAMFWFPVLCFVMGYVPKFGETARKKYLKKTLKKTSLQNIFLLLLFFIIVPSCHFDYFLCFSSLYLHAILSISEVGAFLLKTCL